MNVWMLEEGYGSWRMDVGASGVSPGRRADKRRLRGLMPLNKKKRGNGLAASRPAPSTSDNLRVAAPRSSRVAAVHIIRHSRAVLRSKRRINSLLCITGLSPSLLSLYLCLRSFPPSPSCSVIKTLFHWSRECTQRSGYKFIRWMLTLPFFFFPSFFTARHAGDALIGERRDICIGVCATHATAELMQSNPCRTVIHFPEGGSCVEQRQVGKSLQFLNLPAGKKGNQALARQKY